MDKIKEIYGGAEITYEVADGAASLIEARKTGSRITIPDEITYNGNNYPVTSVGKKAFLSQKTLQYVSLPKTVNSLGDYSFGRCINLKKLVIRGDGENLARVNLERGVFSGDDKLENICFGYDEADDFSALLGCVASKMKAEHLLSDASFGTDEWFLAWDKELLSILDVPDEYGFDELQLCGEEDVLVSFPEYIRESRQKKAGLVLNRLLHDYALSEENFEKITGYICRSALYDAWEVIKKYYAENLEMLEVFCYVGAINAENVDHFLDDMGEMAAAKAFLIGYKRQYFETKNIFDDLEL